MDGPMKSYGRGEKLTIVGGVGGKGKLLALEGSGGGGGSLRNLGCLISLSFLIPSCCSCSSHGRRRDDKGYVRRISTSGDSTRGAGSSLRSCSWATACDCTSSSLGLAIPKVNARRSAILKVNVSNILLSAKCIIIKKQPLTLIIIHRCIVYEMDPY
jgi:hypothetical protein